jgi:hypothetical protein
VGFEGLPAWTVNAAGCYAPVSYGSPGRGLAIVCDRGVYCVSHLLLAKPKLLGVRFNQTSGNQVGNRGNRSNRSGPIRTGSDSDRFPTGPKSKFKFEFKNEKNLKNTSRCVESNAVNNF